MTKTFCDHCGTHIDYDDGAPWALVQLDRRRFDLCETCVTVYTKMLVYMVPPADGSHQTIATLADGVQAVGDEDVAKLLEFVRHEGATL